MPTVARTPVARRATVFTEVDSPVGPLTLTGDGESLTACWFEGKALVDGSGLREDRGPFDEVIAQLEAYFAGELRTFDLPLAPQGTDFQLRVWEQLRAIPYGETRSYGQLATNLGNPGASRAVGLANGRNPLSIIVPCHRVIGADGSLTGYAGGMDRKRLLLDLEAGVAPLI